MRRRDPAKIRAAQIAGSRRRLADLGTLRVPPSDPRWAETIARLVELEAGAG